MTGAATGSVPKLPADREVGARLGRFTPRVGKILREEGPQALWWRGLAVLFYRRLVILAKDAGSHPTPAAPEGLQISPLELSDLEDYRRLRPDTPMQEVRHRLGTGQLCMLARLDGEPVSCRWYSRRRAEVPYLGFSFELPEDTAYGHDGFTAPDARGRQMRLHGHAEELLRDHGIRRFLAAVLPENRPGMRLVVGAGFQPVGRIAIIRLSRRRFIRRGDGISGLGNAEPIPVPWLIPTPA